MNPRLSLIALIVLLVHVPVSLMARPNIVLIISDDAGYADFGFMDALTGRTTEIPTPELDTLRAGGTLFSSAYTGSVCSPSRAAITTGFYQNRLGYEYNTNNLTSATARDGHFPETVTIFEWMKSMGYSTGAIGKWHIGAMADDGDQPGNRPQRQGVDTFFGIWGGSRTYDGGAATRADQLLRRTDVAPDGTITDTVVENQAPWNTMNVTVAFGAGAENFITERSGQEDQHGNPVPFFLYVAFTAPHSPLHNSPDYNDPRISGISNTKRRQYASMILTMDKAIEGIIARLDDPDRDGDTADSVLDNTFFVFINDNGGPSSNASSNYPLRGYKGNPEEGGIRVPMFMAGAGFPVGGVYDFPVHSIDFVPTIAHLAGATDETTVDGVRLDSLDGVDLRPFLNGTNPTPPHEVIVVRKDDRVGLRKGDWKLTASNGTYRLYNLADDIGESQNLALDEPGILDDLIHELNRFEAGSDKPRHAALQDPPESINQNDAFIAIPPPPGGTVFNPDLVIVDGSTLNGDFNATTAPDGKGTFAQTEAWVNIGTGAQTQTATNTNLDYDGTRNAILAKSDLRVFGLDTGYDLLGGEVLHTSYQWADTTDWTDASDRVAVTLFTTDNDTIAGNRTIIEVALSGLSQSNGNYQPESHVFAPVPAEVAGKRLFVRLNPEVSGVGFGRLDNFVLERGSVSDSMLSQFTWSEPNRWQDVDTGLNDTLLALDGFPGAELVFPSRNFDYTATNNLTRGTGLEFMLNRLAFTGNDASTMELDGKELALTDSLSGEGARIEVNSDQATIIINLDLLLFEDLLLSGTGSGLLQISGQILEESKPCHLHKEGPFKLQFNSAPSNRGQIIISEGSLSVSAGVDISNSAGVVIGPQGRLSGEGRVSSPLTIRGVLEKGTHAGSLSSGNLILEGAKLDITTIENFPAEGLVIVNYDTLTGEFASTTGLPEGYHVDYAFASENGSLAIAVVPNTPFDDWAHVTSGLSGAAAAFAGDPNGDGVSNGMAYLLGAESALADAEGLLPQTSLGPTTLMFQFDRLKDAAGVSSLLTGSPNLNDWSLLENGTDGILIEVFSHSTNSGLESVRVQMPLALPRFIRLLAVEE
ncbi:MAG: sulfatase [Puniceicoccaceae bacterium]